MKKLFFIAVFMLFASITTNATTTKISIESELLEQEQSCFEWARSVVITMDGEVNLDNVSAVNYLTAVCEN